MATVTVRFHDDGILTALERLGKAGRTGIARSLNRTATTIEARLARDVAKDTGLRVGVVKDEIRRELDVDNGSVRIVAEGRRLPLIAFDARGPEPSRGKGRGVTARSFGGRKRYPHAFIATVKGPLPTGVVSPGHRGVFQRRAGAGRLPIRQLHGPSIPHVFAKYMPAAARDAGDLLAKNLEHELEFALSRSS